MQAGQEEAYTERDPNQSAEEQAANEEAAQAESSLIELVTAMVILVRETWKDRWSLFRAELRLSLKSALLILLLLFCLAMAAMMLWALLVGSLSVVAWQQGVHWGWILSGLVLAHLALIAYLRHQVRRLVNWMGFPATRDSFAFLHTPGAPSGEASSASGTDPQERDKSS